MNETFEFGGMCSLLSHNFDKLPPKGANSERKDFLWLMVREGRDDHGKACTGVEHPHLWQREHEEAGCMVEAVRK